jgi:rare lipoprotein A
MLDRGTARVEVRALTTGAGEPPRSHAVDARAPDSRVVGKSWVQVASFGERANARRLAQSLDQAGLGRVRVVRARVKGERVYRVRIGPFADRLSAERVLRDLGTRGFGPATIVVR